MAVRAKSSSKSSFWKKHFHTWKGSGISRHRYAIQYGINPRSFSFWCKNLLASEKSPLSIEATSFVDCHSAQTEKSGTFEATAPSSVSPDQQNPRVLSAIIPKAPEEKWRFWEEHIKAWRKSEMSQQKYSFQNGISQKTLSAWIKRLSGKKQFFPQSNLGSDSEKEAKAGGEMKFVPVPSLTVPVTGRFASQSETPIKTSEDALSVLIGSRFRVIVRSDFSSVLLKKLIQTLEEIR